MRRTLYYDDGLYFQMTAPTASGTFIAIPTNYGGATKFTYTTADYAKPNNNGMVFKGTTDCLWPG